MMPTKVTRSAADVVEWIVRATARPMATKSTKMGHFNLLPLEDCHKGLIWKNL